MGRNKTISDEAVLDRLLALLKSAAPDSLTFARASQAVGLSGATLVQRFGTREAMVEAILLHAWDRLNAVTAEADANAPISPAGAVEILMRLMPEDQLGYSVTDGLLLLREDIRNPTLRARGAAWGTYLAGALGRRLTDDAAHAEQMGWQMASMWQGALIWWAFKRERDRDATTEIEAVLEDWCRSVGAM
ncbi:TetR/AcrR family transcriptional regulator [Rhizobium calliandrae]|uniref:TetR/AcrR family transcriptional regulator n=1 Tax=Rhizobium calliandrae TaxID=1312182 RepID=A0ABT7KNN4_9HYPH|nr:TetR/AcrR family transcriptional regulator [Rhizobium calliandrae]MDL2409625.1 TetR/AcrR family transcriptional regulator [Rhizobium calliandrae]